MIVGTVDASADSRSAHSDGVSAAAASQSEGRGVADTLISTGFAPATDITTATARAAAVLGIKNNAITH